MQAPPAMTLAEAASLVGWSTARVRRRYYRGQLQAAPTRAAGKVLLAPDSVVELIDEAAREREAANLINRARLGTPTKEPGA